MRQAVSAILIAAGVLATSSAMAQQRGPATDGARGGERFAMFSPEDRAAMTDARIAALRAGLRLTPDQEKSWPAVESAMRDLAKQRSEVREKMRDARRNPDPITRLRAAADAMGERSAGLKRLADASEPLYRSLDEGQKRRLHILTRQAMRPQMGPHQRRGQ
jgi:zinc resistance-associated protein